MKLAENNSNDAHVKSLATHSVHTCVRAKVHTFGAVIEIENTCMVIVVQVTTPHVTVKNADTIRPMNFVE